MYIYVHIFVYGPGPEGGGPPLKTKAKKTCGENLRFPPSYRRIVGTEKQYTMENISLFFLLLFLPKKTRDVGIILLLFRRGHKKRYSMEAHCTACFIFLIRLKNASSSSSSSSSFSEEDTKNDTSWRPPSSMFLFRIRPTTRVVVFLILLLSDVDTQTAHHGGHSPVAHCVKSYSRNISATAPRRLGTEASLEPTI
eukprot:GEMP01029761.1.p1 GENE.GEMP01029761.1~~GEMP01029761.1.p1  ORF type:complete len:196 (-),score=17.87 GEMP01029761.1:545-1132(-)